MAAYRAGRVLNIGEYLRRADHGGPMAPRILLGIWLRKLREGQGITPQGAAKHIGSSAAKISRLERGRVGCKEHDVARLLALYGATGDQETQAVCMGLARQSQQPPWWHGYGQLVPEWFTHMMALEGAASQLRCYETQFVPGLLQTEEYCQAVARMGHPFDDTGTIRRRAEMRMKRQERLSRADAPHLWAVLDQAVLERPFGSPAIMRRQCEQLLELSRLPRVTLQYLPFSKGGAAAAGTPVMHVRFALDDLPDLVYLEHMNSATYHVEPGVVENYRWTLELLGTQAESPKKTERYLWEAIRRFS